MKNIVLAASSALLLFASQGFAATPVALEKGAAAALESTAGKQLLRSVLRTDAVSGEQALAELSRLEKLGQVTPSVAAKVRTAMIMIAEQLNTGKTANEAANQVLLRANGSLKAVEQLPETSAATGAKVATTSQGLQFEALGEQGEGVACSVADHEAQFEQGLPADVASMAQADAAAEKSLFGPFKSFFTRGNCGAGLVKYSVAAKVMAAKIRHAYLQLKHWGQEGVVDAVAQEQHVSRPQAVSMTDSYVNGCHIFNAQAIPAN